MMQLFKKEKAMILRIWRKETGMTAKEFAEFHNIPYSTYTKWEEEVTEIPQYILELLALSIEHYGLKGIRKKGR